MILVKISPKGQITIPKKFRKMCKSKSYVIDAVGNSLVLRPVEFTVVDDLQNFEGLAEKAFDFWDNEEDDIYQKFYEK